MKDYKLTQEEFDGVIHYYASFVDESGAEQTTEIALEVFEVIDASQRSPLLASSALWHNPRVRVSAPTSSGVSKRE